MRGRLKPPFAAAAAKNAAKRCFPAGCQRFEQWVEFTASELVVSLGREGEHSSADEAATDFRRVITGGIDDPSIGLAGRSVPFPICRPFKRGFGVREMICARGHGCRIEPIGAG